MDEKFTGEVTVVTAVEFQCNGNEELEVTLTERVMVFKDGILTEVRD